ADPYGADSRPCRGDTPPYSGVTALYGGPPPPYVFVPLLYRRHPPPVSGKGRLYRPVSDLWLQHAPLPQPLAAVDAHQQQRPEQDDRRPGGEIVVEGEDEAAEGDADADRDRPQEHAAQILPEHQADHRGDGQQ